MLYIGFVRNCVYYRIQERMPAILISQIRSASSSLRCALFRDDQTYFNHQLCFWLHPTRRSQSASPLGYAFTIDCILSFKCAQRLRKWHVVKRHTRRPRHALPEMYTWEWGRLSSLQFYWISPIHEWCSVLVSVGIPTWQCGLFFLDSGVRN